MVDDGHDTTIDFAGQWVDYWLTYTVNNRILAILLVGAVPERARGTVDSTYYTHYSSLSTVEANWGLGSLGRGDKQVRPAISLNSLPANLTPRRTLSNVYSFVANATGYTNLDISLTDIPLTNTTGIIPGPLNAPYCVPVTAPDTSAVSAAGGPVFVSSGVDISFTAAKASAPVNLTV
ncbi:hypothetical protein H4582DRAFT_2084362 [Lactarius indigo]|nr:hypothetical protein H4582DRAFT_2084362 [Lactarius indigo]